MKSRRVVLASTSPRRRKLLAEAGFVFEAVVPRDAAEGAFADSADPGATVEKHALSKARSVVPEHPGALVIGADTVVVVDGKSFGKPADEADAKSMLAAIAGRDHLVYTGVAVVDASSRGERVAHRITTVTVRPLDEAEITRYVATGEPLDKAGGYAIQGRGCFLVERIDGDYYNVVGLPITLLADLLREFGYDPF